MCTTQLVNKNNIWVCLCVRVYLIGVWGPPDWWACCSGSSGCFAGGGSVEQPWQAAGYSHTHAHTHTHVRNLFMSRDLSSCCCFFLAQNHKWKCAQCLYFRSSTKTISDRRTALFTVAGRAWAGCCWGRASGGAPGASSVVAGCPACCLPGPGTAGRSGWWTADWGWPPWRCDSDWAPACSCCSPGPGEPPSAGWSSSPGGGWERRSRWRV